LNNKEKILSSPAFRRFAGGFELYQKLINREDASADRYSVISRMRELYKPRSDNDPDESNKILRAALKELVLSTLQECENNNFDINNFAEKISIPPLYDLFSEEWNHAAGEVEKASGMIYLNETYAYKIEDNDTISVHVRPSNIESKDTNKKREEGRSALVEKLKVEN